MSWSAHVAGDHRTLEELATSVKPEVAEVERVDSHTIKIKHVSFEECSDASSVKKRAQKFLEEVAGAFIAATGVRPGPLYVAHVWKENDDGTKTVFVLIDEFITMADEVKASAYDLSGNQIQLKASHSEISNILLYAKNNAAVAQVLQLLPKGADWVNLYRIYEVINADLGDKQLVHVSKNKLKLFAHTANSPDVLGHEARHGKSTGSPPSKPMNHGEAQDLIQRMISSWLSTKLTDTH